MKKMVRTRASAPELRETRRHSSPPGPHRSGRGPERCGWEVERSNGLIHDLGAHAPSYAMPPRCGFCVFSPHSPLLTPDRHPKTRRSFMPSGQWHKRAAVPRPRRPSEVPVSVCQTGREPSQLNRHKIHDHCKLCPERSQLDSLSGKAGSRSMTSMASGTKTLQKACHFVPLCTAKCRPFLG